MGSGHILAYLFDVLMQIYRSAGYGDRDAAASIVEHNLYGLDIDDRAAQMAYFVVIMKGCHYDSRFLRRHLSPHVYAIQESNGINRNQLKFFGNGLSDFERNEARLQLEGLLDTLTNAKEYGSILNMENYNWALLRSCADAAGEDAQMSMDSFGLADTVTRLKQLIDIGEALGQKYDVVVTNPPYMGGSGMNGHLSDYVKKYYPDSKSDLFAVFIERCAQMDKRDGYQAMITQHAWMFLSSFEKLRAKLQLIDTVNMAHLGARGFDEIGGEVVQTTSFVMRSSHTKGYKGTYCRLIDGDSEKAKAEMFVSGENRYVTEQDNFSKIPGSPFDYWLSDKYFALLTSKDTIGKKYRSGSGLSTADNDRFLRYIWEVNRPDIAEKKDDNKKWFLFNKGGEYRKWYGNLQHVVNWENDGAEIKYWVTHNPKDPNTTSWSRRIFNTDLYFLQGITWSVISSGRITFRAIDTNAMISNAAGGIFGFKDEYERNALMAAVNSKIWTEIFSTINPTLNYSSGIIQKAPCPKIIECDEADECVSLSKSDWDSFETSWDFAEHPLVKWSHDLWDCTAIAATMDYYYHGERPKVSCPVELCYMLWQGECNDRFAKLKANEEELNRIFIDIYGLQDELTPEVEDKDVTVRRADLARDIRSLISYAVGCIFGRYSLDQPGLAYAGGDWNLDQYHTFTPDADNVIPITDEEYFTDDLTGLFVAWVKKVFGAGSLEDNLAFIAKALGTKGSSPRAVIRNYFLNGFYADHVKIYQKRPIYWLYDSGKQNGFKALIYMHRYNADTSGLVRADYLYKMEQVYESEIARMEDEIAHGASREVAQATKRKEKLVKQLKECKDYDDRLGHIALARIHIDLDDGVKVNYEKVQTGADGKKQAILAKI